MVKGYTRGSGNSRKFIPTRDIHRGLSKAQISHGVEPPISAGNEMLQRKKIEIDKSKKYDVKELYKVYDREYGNTRDQVCSVCGEKQINFIEDHIREKHPELLKEKRDKQELDNKIIDDIKVAFTKKSLVHSDNGTAQKYNVKVTFNGKSETFEFTDSINAHDNGDKPEPKDVLSSLGMDYFAPDDEDEFYEEFGYDPEMREGSRIFKAVQKEKEKLNKIFDSKDMEKLSEDLQDY